MPSRSTTSQRDRFPKRTQRHVRGCRIRKFMTAWGGQLNSKEMDWYLQDQCRIGWDQSGKSSVMKRMSVKATFSDMIEGTLCYMTPTAVQTGRR